MTINLYKNNTLVGNAKFDKAKNAYRVSYSDESKLPNALIPQEDFDAYRQRMGVETEEDKLQMRLF